MRDRLIELLCFVPCKAENCSARDGDRCGDLDNLDRCQLRAIADHLLANGVIVPPCKVGTRVYRLVPDLSVIWPDHTEYKIVWDTFRLSDIYSFGKTVFLTREDAEKALKGGAE